MGHGWSYREARQRLLDAFLLRREFESEDEVALLALLRCQDAIRSAGSQVFAARGSNEIRFNVLKALEEAASAGGEPALGQSELSEVLVMKPAGLGALLSRMEAEPDPSVVRTRDANGRTKTVRLTAAGQRLLDTLKEGYYGFMPELFRGLDGAEKETLVCLLERIRDNVDSLVHSRNFRRDLLRATALRQGPSGQASA